MQNLIPMLSLTAVLLVMTLAGVAAAKDVKEEKWARRILGLATIPAVLAVFFTLVTLWLVAGLSQLLPQIVPLSTPAMLVLSVYPGYKLPRLLYRVQTKRDTK